MKIVVTFALLIWLLPPGARADEVPREIEYLLSSIGSSHCAFIRNGKRHSAQDAEAHLRMKYRRAKRYAPTSERFIERLGSRSSMSNELYYIECESEGRMAFGKWLTQRLNEYRANSDDGR